MQIFASILIARWTLAIEIQGLWLCAWPKRCDLYSGTTIFFFFFCRFYYENRWPSIERNLTGYQVYGQPGCHLRRYITDIYGRRYMYIYIFFSVSFIFHNFPPAGVSIKIRFFGKYSTTGWLSAGFTNLSRGFDLTN